MDRGSLAGVEGGKVCALSGTSDLENLMLAKRVRWAVSVYGKALPALRGPAEAILRELLGPEVELRWMEGTRGGAIGVAAFGEASTRTAVGSREEGRSPDTTVTAAATRTKGLYLGQYATVIDTEEAALCWPGRRGHGWGHGWWPWIAGASSRGQPSWNTWGRSHG